MSNPFQSVVAPDARSQSPTLTLSLDEAAKELRVSVRTVYTLIQTGKLPAMRIGTRRLIPRSGLLAFIEANIEPSAA